MKKLIVGIVFGAALGGLVGASASSSQPKWDHYRSRNSGNAVVIKNYCLSAEDVAAHLKLQEYSPREGVIAVYGCYKKGY
jgi:hypothetical protein